MMKLQTKAVALRVIKGIDFMECVCEKENH